MRHTLHTIVIAALLLATFPMSSYARNSRGNGDKAANYHFGYLSAAAGYTSLSQNIDNLSTKGSFAYLVGAGYEFRRTSFWLSVGAQYLHEQATIQLEQDIKLEHGLDDQGKEVDYYRYNTWQKDVITLQTIDVPILLGYYYNGFYVGAGAKVGLSIASTIGVTGNYELSAKYKHMDEEFHHVGWLTDYNVPEQKFDYAVPPQFSILGEIGYDLLSSVPTNKAVCHVLKLGFYFEYGLRSIRGTETMDPISINGASIQEAREKQYDVRKVTINPYYLSEATLNKRIVPYFVGVKLTYMIGGNRYATGTWHKGCQCYDF